MAEHGGYRQPSNPAPVSGPGAHSQRTDRGPAQHDITGGSYGSGQAFRDQQSAAPLAAAAGAPGSTPAPAPLPVSMAAPTEFADQPVTAGADAGAGPSMADIGIAPQETDADLKARLGPALPALMRMADSQYSTAAYRQQVRSLIARIT